MGFFSEKKKIICEPYEKLARIYDFVMNHVNYHHWTDFIVSLLQNTATSVGTILELSCGTGNFAFHLSSRGYTYFGMDCSAPMIARARMKMADKQIFLPVWVGDMQDFRLKQPVDAVFCLYDSINYLKEPQDWQKTFWSIRTALKEGGILIFDITTVKNSLESFSNLKMREDGPGFHYDRNSIFDRKNRIQWTEFLICFDDDPEHVYFERHYQHVFTIEQVLAMIPKTDFKVIGYYSDFTQSQGTEAAKRVHFILQKKY